MTPGRRLLAFNAVGALGMGVQLACVWFLTAVAHVHIAAATAAGVTLAVAHNFVWHRLWTWRDRRGGAAGALTRFVLTNGALSLAGNVGVVAVLAGPMPAHPVIANGAAIVVCGLVNVWLCDAIVFRS